MKYAIIMFLLFFGSESFAAGIKLSEDGVLFDFPIESRKITYNGKTLKVSIPKTGKIKEIKHIQSGFNPSIEKIDFSSNEKVASYNFHFPVEVKTFAKKLHSKTAGGTMFLKIPRIRDLSKEKNVRIKLTKKTDQAEAIEKTKEIEKSSAKQNIYPDKQKTSEIIKAQQKKIIESQKNSETKIIKAEEGEVLKEDQPDSLEKRFQAKLKQYNQENQKIMDEKTDSQLLSASLKSKQPEVDYQRYFGGLFLFFSVLFIGVFFLKKSKKGSLLKIPGIKEDKSRIKVEDTQVIGVKQKLMILSVDGERFLVCQTPQGCQLLSQINGTPANESPENQNQNIKAKSPKTKAKKRESFANIIKDSSQGTNNIINQIRRKIDNIQEESFV